MAGGSEMPPSLECTLWRSLHLLPLFPNATPPDSREMIVQKTLERIQGQLFVQNGVMQTLPKPLWVQRRRASATREMGITLVLCVGVVNVVVLYNYVHHQTRRRMCLISFMLKHKPSELCFWQVQLFCAENISRYSVPWVTSVRYSGVLILQNIIGRIHRTKWVLSTLQMLMLFCCNCTSLSQHNTTRSGVAIPTFVRRHLLAAGRSGTTIELPDKRKMTTERCAATHSRHKKHDIEEPWGTAGVLQPRVSFRWCLFHFDTHLLFKEHTSTHFAVEMGMMGINIISTTCCGDFLAAEL